MDDPITVDPKHYNVEFENDQVRIVRITYGPGEKSVMHGHPSSVLVFLTDCHGRFTYEAHETLRLTIISRKFRDFWYLNDIPFLSET